MKRRLAVWIVLLMVAGAITAIAADGEPVEVKGEVVQLQLQQRQQLQAAGEFDHVMIQTRTGEQMRVRLGAAGTTEGMVAEGDQVRMRLMAGGPVDGAYQARSMQVRRTGESVQYRNEAGEMLQTQTRTRTRLQDGTGDGAMTRTRTGQGSTTSGSRGSGGGGSRGGGGR